MFCASNGIRLIPWYSKYNISTIPADVYMHIFRWPVIKYYLCFVNRNLKIKRLFCESWLILRIPWVVKNWKTCSKTVNCWPIFYFKLRIPIFFQPAKVNKARSIHFLDDDAIYRWRWWVPLSYLPWLKIMNWAHVYWWELPLNLPLSLMSIA